MVIGSVFLARGARPAMRAGTLVFAPRLVPTLAAIAFIALTVSLGRWQAHRAEEKTARQALFERRLAEAPVELTAASDSAEPLLYRHVHAAGRWIAERQIFVDNQVHDERAGFYVVTPLRLRASGDVVLVNRGWIARDAGYPRAPAVPVPAGEVEVSGLAALPPARFLELSSETVTGDVWQNLSLERYAAWSGLRLVPVEILADPPGPGLVAVREKPDAGVAKHVEYEYTWFLLAGTAFALWVALNLRRAP